MVTEIKIKKEKPLEKVTQKNIVKLLKDRGFSVDVITSGLYGNNGVADIIACRDGRYVALEVKRFPGMKPSKIQDAWLADKVLHGAIAKCVGSVEEARAVIDYFFK